MSTFDKWRTTAPLDYVRKPIFDLALAIKNSRIGISQVVGYASPLLVFLYLKAMGASFLFAGCIGSALLGFIYLPMIGGLVNLATAASVLSYVWLALVATMYLSHQPDGQGFEAVKTEATTVWLHSLVLVSYVLKLFKPWDK